MTVTEDIAAWAKTRPPWQQRLLHDLAAGQRLDEAAVERVLIEILDPTEGEPAEPLDVALPAAGDEQVVLLALEDCKGVNALADDNELAFAATGLTVVYGDNGSGKSGYARLLKDTVGARHATAILPDVFEETPDQPSATVRFAADGDERQHKHPGPAHPAVRKVSFYDEHCGDVYLSKRSTLTYRPSALVLLDSLIEVSDRIRDLLLSRIHASEAQALDLGLPPSTSAAAFVASLTAATTDQAIADGIQLAADAADRHALAAGEVARLQGSNASAERTRLERLATVHETVAGLVDAPSELLSQAALDSAGDERDLAAAAREAAAAAASLDFPDELPGVGGAAWRLLWEAARDYSTRDAYPTHTFPATHDGARCVLCQQDLTADAAQRLRRFNGHMLDVTQRDAARANAAITRRLELLTALGAQHPDAAADLASLNADAPALAEAASEQLNSADQTLILQPGPTAA